MTRTKGKAAGADLQEVNDASIHEKLDKILSRLDSFDRRLVKVEEAQKDLINTVEYLSNEIEDMKSTKAATDKNSEAVKQTSFSLNYLEHQNRQKQLVLSGIPYKPNENLVYAVEKISGKLECNIRPDDIDSIYRVKRSPTIMVRFLHTHKRNDFLSKYRKSPISTTDLGFQTNDKIYVNELLSPTQAALFFKARNFRKNHNFKYVWTANQQIYLRKEDSGDAIRITSTSDLDGLTK